MGAVINTLIGKVSNRTENNGTRTEGENSEERNGTGLCVYLVEIIILASSY